MVGFFFPGPGGCFYRTPSHRLLATFEVRITDAVALKVTGTILLFDAEQSTENLIVIALGADGFLDTFVLRAARIARISHFSSVRTGHEATDK